jgi:uncharacterized protein
MSRIEIGHVGGRAVSMDLAVLLRSRALVTANSGGGKSWLLRRLAEQLFGKVPVWIIDPEGEFATLREKFGFVLVGKGGETPADPRTAPLVAHKLRELQASAVFDLYDLKPPTRHAWVRAFLEALMNLPKSLWKPLVVMLDEAHVFCPEKGMGESEAFGAVQDAATRGRKRGICLIPYTQRLAKISKTVTAELLNRLVGMTREGVDIDRAVEVLSVARDERDLFRVDIKKRKPGEFYAMGPAIGDDRILLTVGAVQTTHPEVGSEISDTPPPAPEKIRALLPKLADLPKEAEAKAVTESDLRAQIRSLKAQLVSRPKEAAPAAAAPPPPKIKTVQIRTLRAGELPRLAELAAQASKAADRFQAAAVEISQAVHHLAEAERGVHEAVDQAVRPPAKPFVKICPPVPTNPKTMQAISSMVAAAAETMPRDTTVSRPQLRILQAIAMFEALGFSEVPRTWVAPLADTTWKSSGYEKNVSTLKTGGYLETGGPGMLRIRPEGRGEVGNQLAPTHELLLQKCFQAISGPQRAILQTLVHAWPGDLPREDIAARSETTVTSSGFEKNMSTLKTAGMIEITGKGRARAAAWLFPEV